MQLKEPESLWENPYSATKDWEACAEQRPPNYARITLNFNNLSLEFKYTRDSKTLHTSQSKML